jgi:hypothetical protein
MRKGETLIYQNQVSTFPFLLIYFAEFKDVINLSLKKLSLPEKKAEMDSLLTLEFQLFDDAIYQRA